MNPFRTIDLNNWKRAAHCAVFRNCAEPMFCVTLDLDVTLFSQKVKREGLSFTFSLIYAATECANRIEEFRYRFLNGNVVLFEKIDTAFTWFDRDTELFKVVNVPFSGTVAEYAAAAKRAAILQKEFSFLPCRGSHTGISRTRTREKRTTPRPCSIGENIMNKTGAFFCPFPYRYTIPLRTAGTWRNSFPLCRKN